VTYVQSVVLGLVQGVTEFLPVSSSGHLILVPWLFGWPDQGLAFDAVMHLGTIGALLVYFRGELVTMGRAASGRTDGRAWRRLVLLLVVATLPALVVGMAFGRHIEAYLRLPIVVAITTTGWAIVMFAADRLAGRRRHATQSEVNVSWGQGLFVGCAQALALVPGTSRSGITITAGLLGGLDRATAARFAFLIGIPITTAVGGYKALKLSQIGVPSDDRGPLVVGVLVAFVSGWASVAFLVRYLQQNSLLPFIAYRVALGMALFAVVLR
jgi:undecaprenyl-diphosphatase